MEPVTYVAAESRFYFLLPYFFSLGMVRAMESFCSAEGTEELGQEVGFGKGSFGLN